MKTHVFLHIEQCEYLHEYQLRLKFTNGETRLVDLGEELVGEIFEPLRDMEVFRQVRVSADSGTIEWPNGADFAPEFLYEKSLGN